MTKDTVIHTEATDIIKAAVDTDDADFIDSNINLIQGIWEKRQQFRTETEMRVSVLNDRKFPTVASKYWQAVRELSSFYDSLVSLSFRLRRNNVLIRDLENKIEKEYMASSKKELLQIDLEEALYSGLHMKCEAKDRMREVRLWCTILDECVEADSNFDTENPNTHQLLSYTMRFKNMAEDLPEASSMGEKLNIRGQLETALRHVHFKGVEAPGTPKIEK